MNITRYSALLILLVSSPAFAAGPVYFDLGGLIFFGIVAIVLFVGMLVLVIRTKSPWVRCFCLLGLGSYVAIPMYSNHEAHKISSKGSGFRIFQNEQLSKSAQSYPLFEELCRKHGHDQRPIGPIRGIRLIEAKSFPEASARGWDSGLAFFAGGIRQIDSEPMSVIDSLKYSMNEYRRKLRRIGINESPFLEFQNQDGKWMRYEAPTGRDIFVEYEANESLATHGVLLAQIKTGLEKEHTIYGGSVVVVNLSTKSVLPVGTIVGSHVSYTMDRHFGAHTKYSLIPGAHCVGPNEGNFLTEWFDKSFAQ